jgi:proline iminopeptidase
MPESPALYAKIEAYDQGFLKVSPIHTVYYEQSGNPTGKPVIYLHGGPGGGVSAHDRRYFDPSVYRIILLDQRGAGKSTPTACLEDNTTWALVDDIEKLREHLGIDKWVVFGGSWGSTLR